MGLCPLLALVCSLPRCGRPKGRGKASRALGGGFVVPPALASCSHQEWGLPSVTKTESTALLLHVAAIRFSQPLPDLGISQRRGSNLFGAEAENSPTRYLALRCLTVTGSGCGSPISGAFWCLLLLQGLGCSELGTFC